MTKAMNEIPPEIQNPVSIEQLLLRDDTWLGHSGRFANRKIVQTGYEQLDSGLLNGGWPLGGLVEVCQAPMQAEWHLLGPALQDMPGLVILLNPPAIPFCRALIQAEVDLDRMVIVNASDKSHFVSCFIELARANVGSVLAWQPEGNLTYTELRKCALAAGEGSGALCVIIRPSGVQRQNSPATLRLYVQLIPTGLEVTAFKQKGFLQKHQPEPIVIALPETWQPVVPYYALNQASVSEKSAPKPRRLASVTPLRGKS